MSEEQQLSQEDLQELGATQEEVTEVSAEVEAPEPEVEATGEAERKEPQNVPLAVHMRQREKFERELQEMRRQQAIGQQRLEQLMMMRQQQPPAPEPEPDFETEPADALYHGQRKLQQQIEAMNRQLQQRQQQEQAVTQAQMFHRHVQQDEAQFTEEAPDYEEAVQYMKGIKAREYEAIGLSPQQAQAKVMADAAALARFALSQGSSPARAAYNLAKALGYQQRPAGAPTGNGSGGDPIAMRKAAQTASRGGGGSGGSSRTPTFAELANMSDEEFSKLTSGGNWAKLAG